jgi:hypothetical protein
VEYRNEMLDALVGRAVLVAHLNAPNLDEEAAEVMAEDMTIGWVEVLKARHSLRVLVGYDGVGVTLRTIEEEPYTFFLPWSAIIQISAAQPGQDAAE